MSYKRSIRRAMHYKNPNATADEAFDCAWQHAQGRYASRRMKELESANKKLTKRTQKMAVRCAAYKRAIDDAMTAIENNQPKAALGILKLTVQREENK